MWQQVALLKVSPFAAEAELLTGLQWACKHCPGLSQVHARNHRGPLLHWSASSKCLSTLKLKVGGLELPLRITRTCLSLVRAVGHAMDPITLCGLCCI